MDIKDMDLYLNMILDRFYQIGSDKSGGVTRLAYTKEEDLMHEEFSRMAEEEGYLIKIDEVGNTFVSLRDYDSYHLIGSHLDSVVNGGRYDGVLGVAIGMVLLKVLKETDLDIPLKIVAFRCEESSNFMKSTLGSGLVTEGVCEKDFETLLSRKGERLKDIFIKRGYSKKPKRIEGVDSFIELHIEQGRVLEEEGLELGLVDAIAGNIRLEVCINGLAEHSGGTPMDLRKDALCGAAEVILGIESLAKNNSNASLVATVGALGVHPGSVNVIPGKVVISVDIRDVSNERMKIIKDNIRELVEQVCENRDLSYTVKLLSGSDAVRLDEGLINILSEIATNLGFNYKTMTSGAGHDAMKMAGITRTGLIFIPCKAGISHNPREDIETRDAIKGAMIMLEYLKHYGNGMKGSSIYKRKDKTLQVSTGF